MSRPIRDLKDRFLEKVQILPNGCWYWLGSKCGKGYGAMWYNGRHNNTHRISAFLFKGFDLSSDLLICHHCDNPPCVNPEHLFEGTYHDNNMDAGRKGRQKGQSFPGEMHSASKLTDAKVRWIRENYTEPYHSKYTLKELGAMLNVSHQTIYRIVKREAWKHV